MDRKRIIVVVLFSLIMFLNGCINKNELGRYYNKEYGYSIRFPSGWEKANTPVKGLVVYVSVGKIKLPDSSDITGFVADVSVGVINKKDMELEQYPADLEQYAERVKAEHKQEAGYVLVEERREFMGGLEAKALFFEQRLYGETRVESAYFTIVDENRIYHITFHTTSDKYPQYVSIFKECFESFRFENK